MSQNIETDGKKDDFNEKQYCIDRLWANRDFEIKHFWTRLTFLTVFITISFTGYGSFVLKVFWGQSVEEKFLLSHIVCIGIAIVGIILGCLWIMMAKGSKFWFGAYERMIKDFEIEVIDNSKFRVDPTKPHFMTDVDSNLFGNLKSYRYSVSKIPIFMGQVFVGIWVLLILAHSGCIVLGVLKCVV